MLPIALDLTQSAATYAEVSGLLAGFGITLLVLLIDGSSPTEEGLPPLRQSAVPLIAILILMNGAATIMWGYIAGSGQATGSKLGTMAYLSGFVSTLSVVVAVTGIQIIIPSAHYQVRLLRTTFVAAVALLNLLGITLATFLLLGAQMGHTTMTQTIDTFGGFAAALTGTMLVIIMVGLGLGISTPYRERGLNSPRVFVAYCILLLVTITAISLGFGVTAFSQTVHIAGPVIVAINLVWALFTGWSAVFLPG
ncbi:MAG: hypothetical protein ACFB51_05040 [Anaerolineae bacterium]